mgnify:CR=1 FL=1
MRNGKAITPIYASRKGNEFVGKLIKELKRKQDSKEILWPPWITTGNRFCSKMIKKHKPEIEIFPMHYFIQFHPKTAEANTDYRYVGEGKIYANHHWGTTRKVYDEGIK